MLLCLGSSTLLLSCSCWGLLLPVYSGHSLKLVGEDADSVEPIITSPDKFAEWFNLVVPGAYRNITTQDVRDMTNCGLICRYRYYVRDDLQTVRAVLLYEQSRDRRSGKEDTTRTCKRCGQPLPAQTDGKRGRPSEYCPDCEPFRGREIDT